jgi:hypothetical protein
MSGFVRTEDAAVINLRYVRKIDNTEGDTYVAFMDDGTQEKVIIGECTDLVPAQPGWECLIADIQKKGELFYYSVPVVMWAVSVHFSDQITPVPFGADCLEAEICWAVRCGGSDGDIVVPEEYPFPDVEEWLKWVAKTHAARIEERLAQLQRIADMAPT